MLLHGTVGPAATASEQHLHTMMRASNIRMWVRGNRAEHTWAWGNVSEAQLGTTVEDTNAPHKTGAGSHLTIFYSTYLAMQRNDR